VDNNDVVRRLRYALQLDDSNAARLVALGGMQVAVDQMRRWRLTDDDVDFLACDDAALRALLAGLIIEKRGVRDEPPERAAGSAATGPQASVNVSKPPPSHPVSSASATQPIDNNQIMKQLRIALSMRTEDVQQSLRAGGCSLSTSEIGALFRKPKSRNYRRAGDQVLRQFLAGLATEQRD